MSLHGKRKEIYKYEAPWTVYAMNWSVRPDKRFRLALGSFVEEYNNKVRSVNTAIHQQANDVSRRVLMLVVSRRASCTVFIFLLLLFDSDTKAQTNPWKHATLITFQWKSPALNIA